MLKLLCNILKDERGQMKAITGYMSQKDRGEVPEIREWAGVPQIQQQYSQALQNRGYAPRQFGGGAGYQAEQPGIERQAEGAISRRMGELPSAADYKQQVEASKTQQISRAREREEKRVTDERNMYNRLGLVSSTPWLGRRGEIGEETEAGIRDIESGMDIFGLGYGLESERQAEDIATGRIGQGMTLGAQQRGYGEFGISASMEDLRRQAAEEGMLGEQTMRYLGQGAATPGQMYQRDIQDWGQPTGWDWAGAGMEEWQENAREMARAAAAAGGGA